MIRNIAALPAERYSWPRWCWTPANPPTATTQLSNPVCCDQPLHFFQRSTGGVVQKKRDEGHDSDHTHHIEGKCLDDQIAPRLPEGVERCRRNPATFGEPSEEELFSFQMNTNLMDSTKARIKRMDAISR